MIGRLYVDTLELIKLICVNIYMTWSAIVTLLSLADSVRCRNKYYNVIYIRYYCAKTQ